MLNDINPHGARRGAAFTLTLSGAGLEGAQLLSTLPATFAPVVPREGRSADAEAGYLVELKKDAPAGLYPIRVKTADGLSNLMLFSVGAFPETAEEESEPMTADYSNDSPARAQAIQPPITVNGKLRGYDQDVYRFSAKKGERLVLEVEARRGGSAVDPLLRLLDAAGTEIARNDDDAGIGVDARLDFTAPGDGEYFVAVQDSKFMPQAQSFYRLKVGAFSYAGGVFPLGWARDADVEVELFGGNLPAPRKVKPNLSAAGANGFAMLTIPGAEGALPLPFAVSDRREIIEPSVPDGQAANARTIPPAELEPETIVNGRIARAGEVDRYRLAVTPGDHWLVELRNASLGTSRLYGVLTVYDAAGKKLASAGDTMAEQPLSFLVSAGDTAGDPHLAFKVPPGLREVVVAVEDLLGRGGPGFGYRLAAEKQPPDFRLSLQTPFVNIPLDGSVTVVAVAERRGYMGPIRLTVAGAPPDVLIEGGHITGEEGGQTLSRISRAGVLTITPKPGARISEASRALNLEVWGEAVLADGRTIRRRAAGPGLVTAVRGTKQRAYMAPWLNLDLPAAVVRQRPAALEIVSPRRVRLIQGMEHDVAWKFVPRAPGIRPPMRVSDNFVPGVGNLRVLSGKTKPGGDTGILTMVTTVGTPPMTFDMLVEGTVSIEGRDERLTAPIVTFEVVQGYTVESPAGPASAAKGGRVEFAGRILREPGFDAPIAVKADALPAGISCRPAEVAGAISEYRIACEVAAAAAPGEYEIELASSSVLASRDKESVPYTVPPAKAKLVVTAGAVRAGAPVRVGAR